MRNLGGRSGQVTHPFSEVINRNFVLAAHVVHLPVGLGGVEELKHRPDGVVHVREAAGLRAVPVHLNRLVRQGPLHKVRNHHAVPAALARPHRVEKAHANDRQVVLVVVRLGQKLVHGLRTRVGPAALARGPERPVVRLPERVEVVVLAHGLSVNLGRRGHQDARVVGVGQLQDVLGPAHVRPNGLDGGFHNALHPHGSRKVHHPIARRDALFQQVPVENVALRKREPVVVGPLVHVLDSTGGEVVEHVHVMAVFDEAVCQVAANEAGATRDEVTHGGRTM